jgi:hypothetical protein
MPRRFLLPVLSLAFTAHAGARFPVGAPSAFFERLQAENTRLTRTFTLPTSSVGGIRGQVSDFHLEKGWLSISGRAMDALRSEFILKGDSRSLSGWMVYHDRNLAYEYTTDASGQVVAEEVPISKIFPVCDMHPPEGQDMHSPAEAEAPAEEPLQVFADSLTPHIGPFPGNDIDVLKLQSLPGAAKVYFIDYTPQLMSGATVPKDQTKQDVWQTWQSLSAMLSGYQVNVTTDRAVYAAAGVANSGIANMRDVADGTSMCGISSFGSKSACQVNRYRNGYSTGRILSHEVGHGIGLFHDGGNPGGEYFNGFPSFQWTPLMGNVWPGDRWANALYQYSKGEYTSATQKQDDFTVVAKNFPFREDDIPATRPLSIQGSTVSAQQNRGQINRNTDTDTFTFKVTGSGGQVSLKIDRIEYMGGSMLDVDASIVDAGGKVVVQHNAPAARHAQLTATLPAGDYSLVVKGGGEGTPANGFSNYSSVGFYAIEGTIANAAVGLPERARAAAAFRVRPLSGRGLFRLELPDGARADRITVLTPQGRPVLEERNKGEVLDLSRFPVGLYVVKAVVGGSTLVRTFARP